MSFTSLISEHSGGFGQFQRGERATNEHESATDYAIWVLDSNPTITDYYVDGEVNATGDEELTEAISAARGAVVGGHGTLIAFRFSSGEVVLESFEVD